MISVDYLSRPGNGAEPVQAFQGLILNANRVGPFFSYPEIRSARFRSKGRKVPVWAQGSTRLRESHFGSLMEGLAHFMFTTGSGTLRSPFRHYQA